MNAVKNSSRKTGKFLRAQKKVKNPASPSRTLRKTQGGFALLGKQFLPIIIVLIIAVLAAAVLLYRQSSQTNYAGITRPELTGQFGLKAVKTDSAGIEPTTTFLLSSNRSLSADVIEELVTFSPEVKYKVRKLKEESSFNGFLSKVFAQEPNTNNTNGESAVSSYELKPVTALHEDTNYQVTIAKTKYSDREYQWAFPVKAKFQVLESHPRHQATYVPTNSTVEITMNREKFITPEKYFSLSPNVDGRLEQHGNRLVFLSDQLAEKTVYTATLKKGLKVEGSDEELTQDYTFSFETSEATYSSGRAQFRFNSDFLEFLPDRQPYFSVYYYNFEPKDLQANLYRFDKADQFISAYQNSRNWDLRWTHFAWDGAGSQYEPDPDQLILSFPVNIVQVDYQKFFEVPQKLDPGYYLIDLQAADQRHQVWVQITPVSHYFSVTHENSLVWLADFPSKEPTQNTQITFVDQAGEDVKLGKTDSNGLIQFATPASLTQSVIASPTPKFFKAATEDQPLYIRVSDKYGYRSKANEGDPYWDYLSLDRYVYQMTDTVRFWGVVQGRTEDMREKKVTAAITSGYYYYNEDGTQSDLPVLESKEVVVSPFNTIEGDLSFTGLTPGTYNVIVRDGERTISSATFEVMTYIKPAYQITVTPSKQAIFAGEPIDFAVQAKFYDGTPVPNIALKYYSWWNDAVQGELKLDSDGEGTFTYTPAYTEGDYQYYPRYFEMTFSPSLAEEGEISGAGGVLVFGPHMSLETKSTYTGDHNYLFAAKLNSIVLKDLPTSNSGNSDSYSLLSEYIGEPVPDYVLKAKIIKTTTQKIEDGTYYDPINRVNQKKYRYESKDDIIEEIQGKTDANGEWSFTREYPYQELVSYRVECTGQDQEGRNFKSTQYMYSGEGYIPGKEFNAVLSLNNNNGTTQYSVDDPVKPEVRITLGQLPEKSKILYYRRQNQIDKTWVTSDLTLEENFSQQFVPSVTYRAVMLGPTGFVETGDETAVFKKTDRALSIEINPDKTGYRPGEKVTLNVAVTDKDKKPVAAQVNLAAVDEALFHVVPYSWQPKILDSLYRNVTVWPLSGASDYALLEQGAERGGCFGADTAILMADKKTKPIQDIRVGDIVLASAGDGTAAVKPAVVQGTSVHLVNTYLVINDSLVVTPEHPLFANDRWQPAGNLKTGDLLLGSDGKTKPIESVVTAGERSIPVYNLVVGTYHTYFANGFLAHNAEKAGGPRSNFVDVALYQTIETNMSGQGTAIFTAPDNLTSWRVTALAYDPDLILAGQTAKLVPVALPLFVDSTLNSIYRTGDKPIVRVRGFGNDYQAGQATDFTLTSTSLNLNLAKTSADREVRFDLGAIPAGDHDMTVGVKQGQAQDSVKRKLQVIDNHFRIVQAKEYTVTNDLKDIEGNTQAYTHLVFADAGRGKYFQPLLELSYETGVRSDQTAAAYTANALLEKYFSYPAPEPLDLSGFQVQDTGALALFPYSDSDLEVSAKLADLARANVSEAELNRYLTTSLSDDKADLNRISKALYGLASLGEPVLAKIQTVLQQTELSVEDRLYLAIGLIRLGDQEGARLVYQDTIRTNLRFEGDEAWLESESDLTRRVKLTGLTGILAAELKLTDDANALWSYLSGHYPETDLDVIERALMIRALLVMADPSAASFTYDTGSRKETVKLENGATYALDLAAVELAALRFSDVTGNIVLVSWFERSKNPEKLPRNPDLTLTRKYLVNEKPTTTFAEGDIVKVRLDPNVGANAIDGYYQVTDYLPSGLRPITQLYNRNLSSGSECDPIWYPSMIMNQSVYFTIGKDFDRTPNCTNRTLNYYARVVSPGEYSAEPAVIQSLKNLTSLNVTDAHTITIK
ncbi:MAG: polymorphic toxin-type HINT domain-containing protein [Patescibacteria group bacterium]